MPEKPDAEKKPDEPDPAGQWLAETFPDPEPWPEPRAHDPAHDQRGVQQLKHTRLGDGLRGAATLAAGLYVYDALTDDSGDTGATDMGGDFSGGS
ncbi:hypothetical protein ALI144C_33680 [Actinosynnema sp. ALI-1.44]|uniref:hypothetical protein n=1 Tax=Actinosynnema sp. ALI-1.44 TaxID=1933779 RepID=UPI00097BDB89|nr:hypothetical protein [Actinosynnema sp. ALI-1.44]ONI77058.1 hypothetical protein ALI144C_33680 [Actinosynnema sp. ALI-1.44]